MGRRKQTDKHERSQTIGSTHSFNVPSKTLCYGIRILQELLTILSFFPKYTFSLWTVGSKMTISYCLILCLFPIFMWLSDSYLHFHRLPLCKRNSLYNKNLKNCIRNTKTPVTWFLSASVGKTESYLWMKQMRQFV